MRADRGARIAPSFDETEAAEDGAGNAGSGLGVLGLHDLDVGREGRGLVFFLRIAREPSDLGGEAPPQLCGIYIPNLGACA